MARREKNLGELLREDVKTPEKEAGLYLKSLESKRDLLSSHYALNSLRKSINERIDEIPDNKFQKDEEVQQYEAVKKEYDRRREKFLTGLDKLSEEDKQKISELTNLTSVEVALSTLEGKPESKKKSEASERFTQVVTERSERDVTEPEVDAMIEHAKRTGRLLELSYWEAKKKELQERGEAEANPDRTPPKGFLARVKDAFKKHKEDARPKEFPLGLQDRESITTPKKPSFWGWLKERGKGVWNFGFWEFHQAERFRSETKKASNDVEALATLIKEERSLPLEEAESEAKEITDTLKRKGLNISAPEFYQASKDITERKRKENDEEIGYIIKSSWEDLTEKIKKYRGEEGQDVLTDETRSEFEKEMKTELDKMRDGEFRTKFVDIAKTMRNALDENWWHRYIWGAAEAALGFAGVKFLVLKYEMAQAAKLAAAEKAAAGGAKGEAEKFLTEKMHKNIWTTLKDMAHRGPGHVDLSNQQLTDLSQKVLDSNKMYEPEWVKNVVEGLKSSRVLPEGLPIKIPLEVMKVLGY